MSRTTLLPLRVPPAAVPDAGTRSFIVASTGAGKSTIEAAIVEQYMQRHPSHQLIMIDPKARFEPSREDWTPGTPIFPDGPHEQIIKRRRAVRIHAQLWRPGNILRPQHQISLFTEQQGNYDGLFERIFKTAHARRPTFVVFDETLEMLHGMRASWHFRRLLQEGRAFSLGMLLINQAPKFIDGVMIRETEYLYVGRLGKVSDAKYVRKELVPSEVARRMPEEMEQHKWFLVDRVRPARSRPFELEQEAA